MRITQVSLAIHHGGAERIALDLHRAHRAAGHDAQLLVGRLNASEPGAHLIDHTAHRGPLTRALARRDPRLARPLQWLRRRRGHDVHDQPATAMLLDLAARAHGGHPPEVLHLHALCGGYLDLRQLPRLSHAVPTLLTLHDAWPLTGGAHHQLAGVPLSPIAQRNRAIKRQAYASAQLHLTAPSQWLLDQVNGSILEPAAVTRQVVPNGIDDTLFTPGDRTAARQRLGLPTQGHRALFVAFNAHDRHPSKDLPTIRAAVTAAQTPGLTLDVVGTTGRSTDRITYHGPVQDRSQLADHHRAADVLLHAAHAETFALVVIEAQACGTPVVATAVGGIPEHIHDGITGHLVPPRDPAAMAAATDALLADEPRRAAMAAAARAAAKQRFVTSAMATGYRTVYAAAATR